MAPPANPACTRKHSFRSLPAMQTTPADALTGSGAATLWSRRAVDLCRVATCLCLSS
jgi:hypothetical protein